eukprot:gene6841-7059_t
MDRKSSTRHGHSTSPFAITEQNANGDAQALEQRTPVYRVQPSIGETDNRVQRTGLQAKHTTSSDPEGSRAAVNPETSPQPQRAANPEEWKPRSSKSPDDTPPGPLSPALSQNLDNMEDMMAGHELYRALRGNQADDPLMDSMLWDGNFLQSQKEFLQKQQDEQMLERIERRLGRVRAAPASRSEGGPSAPRAGTNSGFGGTETAEKVSFGAVAVAAATGNKLKNILSKMLPKAAEGAAVSTDGRALMDVAQVAGVMGLQAPEQGEPTGQGALTAGTAAADSSMEVSAIHVDKSHQATVASNAMEKAAAQDLDSAAKVEAADHEGYSWVRRMSIKICTHSDFELLVMLLIFGNCISLAAYDPLEPDGGPHNIMLEHIDLGLNIAFTVEMVLRILSMGSLISYLSHPWNAFDGLMVLAGYTTFIPVSGAGGAGLSGINALRAMRALRPLRTITRFRALRSIVVCFLEAVPLLVSVAAMLFFFLFIFAVAGTELFSAAYHWTCLNPATNRTENQDADLFDSNQATQIAGFDNVGLAMLSVFQAMTLSNWSFSMYRTMDYLSGAMVIYWFVLIMFGGFFVLNLFLAVLKSKFAKAKNLLDEKRRARKLLKGDKKKKQKNVLMRVTGWAKVEEVAHGCTAPGDAVVYASAVLPGGTASAAPPRGTAHTVLPGAVAAGMTGLESDSPGKIKEPLKPPVTRQLSKSSMGSSRSGYSVSTRVSGMTGMTGMSGTSQATECLLSIEEFDESVQELPTTKRWLMMMQYRVRMLVCSDWFNHLFLLAIAANTVCLAITYHGMSAQLEEDLSRANMVFTFLFTVEMVLKIIGVGLFKYLTDPWSLFDGVVVAFSMVELVSELMARSNAQGLTALRSVRSLRVLRSFRVLRVMKMFKYLESLKMIASVLISSMGSFASIVVLLVLFWMVFSIMGLQMFGSLALDVPWPNCSTLVNALIMTFNVLNLENFQITMYSVIRATNYASALFWLAWIILGKYIFLTLFLAVTLDAFERKYEMDMKKGVRVQSLASSMFSRIKKAGQKLKGAAGSVAGSAGSASKVFGSLLGGASFVAAHGSPASPKKVRAGGWVGQGSNPGTRAHTRSSSKIGVAPDEAGSNVVAVFKGGGGTADEAANDHGRENGNSQKITVSEHGGKGPVAEGAADAAAGFAVGRSWLDSRLRRRQSSYQYGSASVMGRGSTHTSGGSSRRSTADGGDDGLADFCFTAGAAPGYADALADVLAMQLAASQVPSSSKRRQEWSSPQGTSSHPFPLEQEEDYTWHEFLSTIAAIDHPALVRQQQKALAEGTAKGANLRPIAEGVEGPQEVTHAISAAARASMATGNGDTLAGSALSPGKAVAAGFTRTAAGLFGAGTHSFSGSGGAHKAAKQSATHGSTPSNPEDLNEVESLMEDFAAGHTGTPVGKQALEVGSVTSDSGKEARAAPTARAREPRRVTLFTESMKNRGEKPLSPRAKSSSVGFVLAGDAHEGAKGGDMDEVLQLPGMSNTNMLDLPGMSFSGAADVASLLGGIDGTGLSVEPSITAKAIKRRKAAAANVNGSASMTAEEGGQSINSHGTHSPGMASRAALTKICGLPLLQSDAMNESLGAESSAPSDSHSHATSASAAAGRRSSRLRSEDEASVVLGSEGALSINSHTPGTQSGNWSTGIGVRSRRYPELSGTSLWLLSETNPFRVRLYDIVTSRWFDYFMFFFILLNCVEMAYEYPDMSREDLDGKIMYWSDMVFTIFFSLEALFKVLAFGFRPYMSFFQNQVDFLIMVSSLAMLFLDTLDLAVIKALRVLRAIKPLRALTRSAGMQLIFKSLTLSLAAMGNVSIVVLLFFIIFAILGVQLFHGKFFSCNDKSVPDRAACIGTYINNGQELPRLWRNAPYNFDNLGMALVSLTVIVTLNGYTEIMSAAMATPEEVDLQPQDMANWSAFFFFVAFVLVVSYTLLNLYIGVVFYQFSRIRMQSQTGSAFLTDDQTEWVELSRLVFRLKPPEKSPVPANAFRRKLYYLVQSKQFEYTLMAVIITNSASMATTFYGMSEHMSSALEAINYAFTCLYVLEFLLKLGGLGWANYWKVSWNKFDFLLLLSSVVDMAVALGMGSHASFLQVQKIMRLLRLARVVKLMRSMKGLRSLFGTLIVSLPAFWNVGALIGLMFFMYSYIGMLLLGNIKLNGGLNEHTNFQRSWTAALTLFKVATNDNWTDVMMACLIAPPDCDPSKGECGSWVAYPYFLSFTILMSIIMLNLFTAVIIESFEAQQEQDRWKLRPDHLDEFLDLWAEYDDGSGTIDPKDLEGMLLRLSPPLGLGPTASSTDVLRFVFDLDIPLINGRVPFQRTAYELVRRCSGAEIPQGILKDQIDRLVARAFKNLKADEVLNFSVAVTVMRVQRKWRSRMRAAKLKRKRELRAERGLAPSYADVVEVQDVVLKSAVQRRQAVKADR